MLTRRRLIAGLLGAAGGGAAPAAGALLAPKLEKHWVGLAPDLKKYGWDAFNELQRMMQDEIGKLYLKTMIPAHFLSPVRTRLS